MSIMAKTAGLIRIPLGMEVDLGPGDNVLDGDPASPSTQRGTAVPHFSAHCSGPHPRRPHFTHNPHCRLGSARRAALVAILRIIATHLVYSLIVHRYTAEDSCCRLSPIQFTSPNYNLLFHGEAKLQQKKKSPVFRLTVYVWPVSAR